MDSADRNNPNRVRSAAVAPTRTPLLTRRNEQWTMPREYLGDHPILVPAITIFLSGLCLYLTLFTHTLRDWQLGPNPLRTEVKVFDDFMSYLIAFSVGMIFLSVLFLSVHGVDRAFHRFTRKPRACPRCRQAEAGKARFPYTTVPNTGWDSVRCPNCGHEWYAKS